MSAARNATRRQQDLMYRQNRRKTLRHATLNHALIDALPAHIAVIDNEGTIVLVNDAWTMFAYQNSSTSGLSSTGVGSNYLATCLKASQAGDVSAKQALDGILSILEGQRAEFSLDYPCETPDELYWFRMTVIPLDSYRGGAVIAHSNITQQKQAESTNATTEQLTERLEQERQLRLRYLASMSHDLRTPLTVIQTSFSLLTQFADRLSPAEIETHQSKIERQLNYLSQMVQDIIALDTAYEGKLSFNPAPLHIPTFCTQMVEEYLSFAPNNHWFSLVLDESLDVALLDEHLLRHILGNLLANALQYTPQGGTITLSVQKQDEEVVFSVSDQGIGIPTEDLPHLFDAFYRGSNAKSINGSGLGLAIVKSCVDMHRGSIEVMSALNEGTTFTVRLASRAVES